MRCSRCGNENPTTNRFCGMCGMSLLQAPSPAQAVPPAKPPGVASVAGTGAGSTPAAVPAAGKVASAAPPAATAAGKVAGVAVSAPPAPPAVPTAPAPSAPPTPRPVEEAPIISGPSFLGLNQPAPAPRRTNPLSIDPHTAPSSSSLDYLLEDDEEEKKRGGGWKFVLMLIVLVLAAGLGYLRWKGQPLPFLGSGANKPSAASQNSGAADTSSPAPSSPAASPAASAAQPAGGASSGSASGSAPGATDGAGASPSSVTPSSAGPALAGSTPVPVGSAPAAPADASGGGGAGPAAAQPRASKASGASAPTTAPAATMKPKPAPVMKPSAAVSAQSADSVALAQKYIYGKGVRQDCDRGLRILKPAADQANAKAMIEMGALYSAGLCTPRDLPTAYRWFALALRKDPTNQALNADLQKLWGEMTQPERQLAIKLSQ